MAAVGLTTVVAKEEPAAGPSPWYRTWHAVSRRPAMLALFLILVSAVLLPVMEVEALHETGPGYAGGELAGQRGMGAGGVWLRDGLPALRPRPRRFPPQRRRGSEGGRRAVPLGIALSYHPYRGLLALIQLMIARLTLSLIPLKP